LRRLEKRLPAAFKPHLATSHRGPHKSGLAAWGVREEMSSMREPENGTPGRQRDRKERNRRIAAAVVIVALVSLATPACSSRRAERPAAGPEPEDIFAENASGEVQGWIAYRNGSEIVAVDPADPTKTISLVPAEDRALIDWSRDGTRLLLQGRSRKAAT
jgi:hypothetical protein